MKNSSALSLLLAPVILIFGCGVEPTYNKSNMAPFLKETYAAEGIDPTVRIVGDTIAVHLDHEGVLLKVGGQIGIGPKFEEFSRILIQPLHRALLSSDRKIDFYVLLFSDPSIPGAYLTMVRYTKDLYLTNVSGIALSEFFSRTVYDLHYLGPQASLSLDTYIQRGIELSEFLSWQLAKRIQNKLMDTFKESEAVQVGTGLGEFRDGEFRFTLNVQSQEQELPFEESTYKQIFETATSEIEQVLGSYEYRDFERIQIVHQPTGRHLTLPKAHLDLIR